MQSCDKCGGSGVIELKDTDKARECRCAVIRRLAAAMPAHIRHADAKREHFLLPVVTGGIKKSYFIKSSWIDMKSIIKAIMMINPSKFIRVTSDREIRDIGVGATSRTARGNDVNVYNTLEDIMCPPSLCIVRLGELSYKNKAASGLLEEALSYRLDRDLPLWVISDLDKPFGQNSFAFSSSVWDLIKSSMKEVLIPRITSVDMGETNCVLAPIQTNTISGSSLAPEPSEPRQAANPFKKPAPSQEEPIEKPKRRIQPTPDEDAPKGLGSYGMGLGTSKKFQRKGD